jgi:diadenosine tetraphosphate (Ap4A) HIT family hydrolase
MPCPFCELATDRILRESDVAAAILDSYPVTEGHVLVVPKRHVESLFELPPNEQSAVWSFVAQVREVLTSKFRPDGFNIGLNDGEAAGQTVMHCHIHVIPRRNGDVIDPRGGVRWIIPEKAAYWRKR